MLNSKKIYTKMCIIKIKLAKEKKHVRNEIELVESYLNNLKELEVYSCYECGKEISYYEYHNNEGYCESCCYRVIYRDEISNCKHCCKEISDKEYMQNMGCCNECLKEEECLCQECGREIYYSEYNRNNGLCNKCTTSL